MFSLPAYLNKNKNKMESIFESFLISGIVFIILLIIIHYSFNYKYKKMYNLYLGNNEKHNKLLDKELKELQFENSCLKDAVERYHHSMIKLTGMNESLRNKLSKFNRLRDPKTGKFTTETKSDENDREVMYKNILNLIDYSATMDNIKQVKDMMCEYDKKFNISTSEALCLSAKIEHQKDLMFKVR